METPVRSVHSTERLTLEPVTGKSAPGLWAAAQASLPELRPWMAWAASSTQEETKRFATKAEEQWASGNAYHFTILHQGEVIGGVSIEVRGPLERLGELGYWVRSDHCGQGFATEAGNSTVDFGFREIELDRLELRAGVGNRASQRVAEKMGFQREGTLRQASRGAEGPYDCYVYGLLATDPRPRVRR